MLRHAQRAILRPVFVMRTARSAHRRTVSALIPSTPLTSAHHSSAAPRFGNSLAAPHLRSQPRTAAVRMAAATDFGDCTAVGNGDYKCTEAHGPGAEYEIDNFGKEFFIYAPKQPKATKADVVEDGCTWLGEYSSKLQMWACKHRPAAGYNCEEEMVDGELAWVCYV